MHINFKSIELHGFLSFGDARLSLDNKGYVLVSGINNNKDDLAKSNGSGKSSLWEAIVWCLTGETVRGTKQVVNRFLNDGTFVSLEFNIDNDIYKVIRYKDYKNIGTNLKVYINNTDKSGKGIRDTEKLLEEYLPDLTASLLGSVVILGQGLPQRFTNNTPSGRKEVLEKLSKSDFMIEDIKNKLTNRKIKLNQDLRQFDDEILSDESKLSILNKNLIALKEDKELLNNQPNYDEEITKYTEQLKFLESNQIDTYNYSLKLNEQLNDKLKEYQDWTSKVNENYLHECDIIDEKYQINILNAEIIDFDVKIKNKQDEIKKLEAIKDVCPTCGQKLPDVHKVDIVPYKEELDNLKKLYEEKSNNFLNISLKVKQEKQTIYDTLNKDTEQIKKEGQELRTLYNDTSKQNEDYLKEINNIKLSLEKIKLNKEHFNSQLNTIENDIKNLENDIDTLSKKILYNNNERDDIKCHLDIINKMLAIATRDFRGFLLSEVIGYINKQAKIYSQDIFETDKIDFSLDGNNINISYCDKQYENLSGGEKQKVDLIVQFSIRDMLSRFLNFSSNILVLDEIFDNCDSIGCQRILNLISTRLIDIESTFIVTHHTDIQIPYDYELIVEKGNDCISRIL